MNANKNDMEYLVQKIRTEYTEKQHTELDKLRELDRKVRTPANVFAYIFGSASALIMGAGMSLVMTDIGDAVGAANPMVPGLIIGIAGLAMTIANYSIYRCILSGRRKKYAPEILRLSDAIMKE